MRARLVSESLFSFTEDRRKIHEDYKSEFNKDYDVR